MVNIKLSVNFLRFDIGRYSGELANRLEIVAKEGIQKYVKAIDSRIPQYTGFLRSAFRAAEEASGGFIQSTKSPTAPFGTKLFYRNYQRDPVNGIYFSTRPSQVFGQASKNNIQSTDLFKPGFIVLFEYDVDIDYYSFLDEARWGARAFAEEVFRTHLAFNLRIPDLDKFVVQVESVTDLGKTITNQ